MRFYSWCPSLHCKCRARLNPVRAGHRISHRSFRRIQVGEIVLLILILFSIASWGIILYKLWALSRAEQQSTVLSRCLPPQQQDSRKSTAVCNNLAESPLVGIFQAGYAELNTQLRQAPNPSKSRWHRASSSLRSLPALDRALLRA